jgi:hypothetical protein
MSKKKVKIEKKKVEDNPWWYTHGMAPDDRLDKAVLEGIESVPITVQEKAEDEEE